MKVHHEGGLWVTTCPTCTWTTWHRWITCVTTGCASIQSTWRLSLVLKTSDAHMPEQLRTAMLNLLAKPADPFQSPGHLAKHLDHRTKDTRALRLIDHELIAASTTPGARLIVSIAPQQGKSTRISRVYPIWLLQHWPDKRIIIGSYGQSLAVKHGKWIRNHIDEHPELGISVAHGSAAKNDWQLADHDGGVLSVGRGTTTTGNPADVLIVDDPIKDRAEADSLTIRDAVWDWWTDTLSTRLAPAAPVIVVLTRWHSDDIAGRLLAAPDGHRWRVVNIPAQAESDDDPLGRQPGEYMDSARTWIDEHGAEHPMTDAMWEEVKTQAGSRTWAALYQGRPSPAEGGLLKRDWWQKFSTPLWVIREDGSHWAQDFDEVIISADLAFKGTTTSDYIAIGVWGRRGTDAYLLDQIHERADFVTTLHKLTALCRKWPQATLKLVEDKANGPALISMLAKRIVGIVPINPTAGKVQRAEAWAPLLESRHVYIPDETLAPWVGDYIEECAAFPNAAHDDQIDQTSMALDRLLLRPLIAVGDSIDVTEDYDDYRIGY